MGFALRCFLAFVLGILAVACASDPGPNNGVNDVKLACSSRATWSRTTTDDCQHCLITSVAPVCDCALLQDPQLGKCASQADARAKEGDCVAALDDCIARCTKADCACVDACYAGHDRCRSLSSARDGCVVAACESRCK